MQLADDGLPVGWPVDQGIATLGIGVLIWAETELAQPDGDRAGDPWQWRESQARMVAWWYAVDGAGRFLFRRGQIVLPKGSGKSPVAAALSCCELAGPVVFDRMDPDAPGGAVGRLNASPLVQLAAVSQDQPLALDTPVQTPKGWKTVRELGVGDHVFGSDGSSAEIARATEVITGLPCYRVTFDDGEEIVASASHSWTLERLRGHGDRYETVTLRTDELPASLLGRKGRKRLRVPLVAVQGMSEGLTVSPYMLGLWLGDGSTRDATIAFDTRVRRELETILKGEIREWETVVWHEVPDTHQGTFRIRRREWVCPRGHDYSAPDRHFVSKAGDPGCLKCRRERKNSADPKLLTFRERLRSIGVLGNKHIPARYATASYEDRGELLRGLVDSDGWVTAKGRAGFVNANERLFEQVCDLLTSLGFRWSVTEAAGTAQRVHWMPRPGEPVAKLQAKAARQLPSDSSRSRSRHRWVESVVPIDSEPVKCIGIDTADHLFVAGRRGTLTHNTDNTMTLVLAMLRDGPAARHIPGLDTGITRVLTRSGKLQPVTASASSREGARLTAAILDETHLWTKTNGGHRLATTIRRNLGKMNGRSIETTNTWVAGELSVAEQTAKYADLVAEGDFTQLDESILRWHPHADVEDLSNEPVLRAGLEQLYGDYPWVNVDRIIAEIYDLGTPPAEARRFYLNQVSADDDAWIAQYEWAARARPEIVVADRDVITVGFDGSRRRSRGVTDATALVGCRVSDGHLFPIRVWEQPETVRDWEVPTIEVEAEIAAMFTRYKVVGFYADPALWETFIASWEAKHGGQLSVKASRDHPIQWRMNRPHVVVEATEHLFSAVVDGEMTHDGSSLLTRHVLNARRRSSRSGVQIAKASPDSANKIDAAIAAILAWQARLDAVAAGLADQKTDFVPYRIR